MTGGTTISGHALRLLAALVLAAMPLLALADPVESGDEPTLLMRAQQEARPRPGDARAVPPAPMHLTPCVAGFAGPYPCSNIDLLAFEPVSVMSAGGTNSLWGWTDPQTGIDYALVGLDNGTGFFNLSTPDHPVYLGKLPTHTGNSLWRDVRTYNNYAFVVSDANGAHGMQVFDLTRLRGVVTPQTFTENAWYNGPTTAGTLVRNVHTIAINEETGFAYLPGSNTCPAPSATGGVHMVNIQNPLAPTFAGCVSTGGYTHETNCWTYHGPDTEHDGDEVCLNSNGSSGRLAIVDVTVKSAPVTLSSTAYAGSRYTHQAWFTDDHRYILMNDELDEEQFGHNARTYVFDAANLEAPVLVGYHQHDLPVIDHNLYVHGQYVYESNYEAGVRILRIDNLSSAALTEVAFFDLYPGGQGANFNGTWNNYRFPNSGVVIATSIDEGLFVLKPNLCVPPAAPTGLGATPNGANRIDLAWDNAGAGARYRVERAQGGCAGTFAPLAESLTSPSYSDNAASGGIDYGYRVVRTDIEGTCSSAASSCVTAQTTGACTAGPTFAGAESAESSYSSRCAINVDWAPATAVCGGSTTYSVYRSATDGFVPPAGTLVGSGVTGTTFTDAVPHGASPFYYVVRALDSANSADDDNVVRVNATASGPIGDGTFASGAELHEPPFDTGQPTEVSRVLPGNSPQHAGWHTTDAQFRTGSRSFWSTVANNLCVSLVSEPIALTAGQTPQLQFWSKWDTENGADAGVVEVSTDDGNNWSRLTPVEGYPGTLSSGSDCGMTPGQGAFTGTNMTWTSRSIAMSAYAGSTIKLRWLFRSNAAVNGAGWFVDDISLTHAQVPGPCTEAGSDATFKDGYEATP